MYPLSPIYNEWLLKPDRDFVLKVEINGTEYGVSNIVDFTIENSLITGDEFDIGTTNASKLTIQLRALDELPANAKVVPYVAISLASLTWQDAHYPWGSFHFPWAGGQTEWMPLGEFYVDRREKLPNRVWTYVCFDKMVWANSLHTSSLTYPATMQALWDEVCNDLDYDYDSTVQINPGYTLPVAPTGYTKRQILGYIAGAHCASSTFAKDGKLRWKQYASAASPVFTLGRDRYIEAKQTNPIKTYTKLVVTYETDDQSTYTAGSGDDNHTLFTVNPFVTQAIVDAMQSSLNGFSYMPLEMNAIGYPQLDQGDITTFKRSEAMKWGEANVAWEDAHIPWDGIMSYQSIILRHVLEYSGGFFSRIESPSASEQESEFGIDGPLTDAINRLNKTTVKEGKRYFGVTMDRETGFTVTRGDGVTESRWNSDEFWFKINGNNVFYLDVPNEKLVFSGRITAAEIMGSFISGGSINGVTITGSTIRTSSSYPRSEMSASGNMFATYLDANNYVTLTPDLAGSPAVQHVWGGGLRGRSSIGSGGDYEHFAVGTLSLISGLGMIDSAPVSYHRFPNWSSILNKNTGHTLYQDLSDLDTRIHGVELDITSHSISISTLFSLYSSLDSRVSALEGA